jgi:sugar/nucleoside kinase (ribokinase family)
MKLVIVGSVALDAIRTPRGEVREALGGSAMYASQAARHFCQTRIVGVVGSDFPHEHLHRLDRDGIDREGLHVVEGSTFRWCGVYNDLNCAETLDTQLGVFAEFDPVLPESYRHSEILFLANIHPALQRSVLDQMRNPAFVAVDTMNFWIDRAREDLVEVLKRADLVFLNDAEVRQLTGCADIYSGARKVLDLGVKWVIVKRGEFGSVAVGENLLFFLPVFPVESPVDPTGAGDSYAGGFLGYLASVHQVNPCVIKQAMLYGTATASVAIESFSLSRLHDISREDLDARKDAIRQSITLCD